MWMHVPSQFWCYQCPIKQDWVKFEHQSNITPPPANSKTLQKNVRYFETTRTSGDLGAICENYLTLASFMSWFYQVALTPPEFLLWVDTSSLSSTTSEKYHLHMVRLTYLDYSNSFDTFVFVSDGLSQHRESFRAGFHENVLLSAEQINKHAQESRTHKWKVSNWPSSGANGNIIRRSESGHLATRKGSKYWANESWQGLVLHDKQSCWSLNLTVLISRDSKRKEDKKLLLKSS